MDVGRKMNECDGLSYARMNLRTSSVALFYLYISTFFLDISLSLALDFSPKGFSEFRNEFTKQFDLI